MKKELIIEFLSKEHGMDLLRALGRMNPKNLSLSQLTTIISVSKMMGLEIKEVWELVELGHDAGLITYYGGLLTRRRMRLSELGEKVCSCTTPGELKGVLKDVA